MMSLKGISFSSLYVLLSFVFAIMIFLSLIVGKAYQDILSKKDFVDTKQKEVTELRRFMEKIDLNYTPRNLDAVKADIFTLIDRLSGRFSVNIDGDFNIVDGKLVTLKIRVNKNNPSEEDVRVFFETLEYPGLFLTIHQLDIEKGGTGNKLEAVVEVKQIFK